MCISPPCSQRNTSTLSRRSLSYCVRALLLPAIACIFFLAGNWSSAQSRSVPPGQDTLIEHGSYTIHLLLHPIGTEEYAVRQTGGTGPNSLVMTTSSTLSDRGMQRSSTASLQMNARFDPSELQQTSHSSGGDVESQTDVTGSGVRVREMGLDRSFQKPSIAFVGFAAMPASLQMMMMRYWETHHRPTRLPILRASERALPLEIKLVGHEAFVVRGHVVRLNRYTVANLIFGREVLWMNTSGRLAAVMTFAGGLPQEEILDEYALATAQLVHSGVRQEMLDLAELDRQVPPEMQGTYAIVGARLIDGTGKAPLENATVVVRDGRIAAAGTEPAPAGMPVVHAEGKSLLPGLWEMHTHYSGVEFGPALLAAGVTTARDCGGELEFLTSVRRKIDKEHALGPKLLLAGLVDSGGPLAFGNVDVNSAAEGVAAVDAYADAGFEQIKVYTQIQPEVLLAISAEAHRRELSVTGHVPAAIDAFEGIADGMDQINHLQFVVRAMRAKADEDGPVDLNSERARKLIALLHARQIVVDPTDGWGEMASHPKNLAIASFEPGLESAPFTLQTKYQSLGSPAADAAKFRERMETNRKVIHALYIAGVPIVAGSDTGLLGYGLDRELELYVEAGMTPLAALQTATLVPAHVMKLDRDSGSVEVGKRADLVLVDGDPSRNISDIRRVVSVVKDGRLYSSAKLAQSVGFSR